MNRVAPSARIEEVIVGLLAAGIADTEQWAEIRRLGAQLILQRAMEDEVVFTEPVSSERVILRIPRELRALLQPRQDITVIYLEGIA